VITPSDRVAAVLRTDERLVEVFASAAPALERLRNPAMRRTMARLVTVAQAAKIAGLDPQELVARLNAAAGSGDQAVPSADTNEPVEEKKMSAVENDIPAALSGLPAKRLVDLDVREDLRRGEEPFSRIMAAKAALKPGEVLRLRATFDPVPLYHVMGKQGYEHWTEQLGEDDWRVWFHRPDAVAAPAEAPAHTESAPTAASGSLADAPEEEIVILDVRGMDPPEPMMLTIAALETLPAGKTLLQINVRVPQFLLPRLEEMGFKYEVREQKDGPVRVFIRR
jgi:uncharacterized protein (DUF2249 family)